MITDDIRAELYPQADEVGENAVWVLPLGHVRVTGSGSGTDEDDRTLEIDGIFLGVATARQDRHNHGGDFAPEGRRCPKCRWFEPRVFRELTGKRRYVMYTLGCSNMPGETDRPRYRFAADAHEAIFVMSTVDNERGTRFLSAPAQRMFDMAAQYDLDIAAALRESWSDSTEPSTDEGRWHS